MRFLLLACLVACSSSAESPNATGATCDQASAAPLTYDSFGHAFMTKYCTSCHSSTSEGAKRHGAPDDDNFDTLDGVMTGAEEIDAVAGRGPRASNASMPPAACGSCQKPTDEERAQLASWLACERNP